MTAPLFTDRDPCGCERALGHVCRVPWMDENEWPERGDVNAEDSRDKAGLLDR